MKSIVRVRWRGKRRGPKGAVEAERITVPLSYTDELYNLRTHIGLVRERLRQTK